MLVRCRRQVNAYIVCVHADGWTQTEAEEDEEEEGNTNDLEMEPLPTPELVNPVEIHEEEIDGVFLKCVYLFLFGYRCGLFYNFFYNIFSSFLMYFYSCFDFRCIYYYYYYYYYYYFGLYLHVLFIFSFVNFLFQFVYSPTHLNSVY